MKLIQTALFAMWSGFCTFSASAQETPIVIHAGTMLDGKGHAVREVQIVVQGARILRVEPHGKGVVTYDLRRLTVLPGWIDVHDHIVWHFGPNGRTEDKTETPSQAAFAEASNAWVTLTAGFTTVQSVGSPRDKDLRTAINDGALPGPRILASLEPIVDPKLTLDQLREVVRTRKAQGADLIKIFASKSIREGGVRTFSDEQLRAACGEATTQGLRTLVHAYRDENEIGSIALGMQADIIALDGDPLTDITAVRRVVFVMKSGRVYRNEAAAQQ